MNAPTRKKRLFHRIKNVGVRERWFRGKFFTILLWPSLPRKACERKWKRPIERGKKRWRKGQKKIGPKIPITYFRWPGFLGAADNPTYFPGNLRSMTQFRAKMKVLYGFFCLNWNFIFHHFMKLSLSRLASASRFSSQA